MNNYTSSPKQTLKMERHSSSSQHLCVDAGDKIVPVPAAAFENAELQEDEDGRGPPLTMQSRISGSLS